MILFLSNRARFNAIGVGELFDAYNQMDKYKFGKKYTAIDVLTKEEAWGQDALMSFLHMSENIVSNYIHKKYGEVLRVIRNKNKVLNSNKYRIITHFDKSVLKSKLDTIISQFQDTSTTIEKYLNTCFENDFIQKEFFIT